MFKPVDPKVNFSKMEEEILELWKRENTFKESIAQRDEANDFVMFDGPPFATGLPHFGHFVPNTIKDVIPRYQTMKGHRVERRFGWDCHGLPVEYEMEKELGISGKSEVEKFGVAEFNEKCRSIVLRYTKEWEKTITRLGRWVDFENDYKTMDTSFMESIWWVFKTLWDQGLVYEGHYILPYCPRCSTVLSNNELNLGGYKDVHDPSITVRFKVKDQENTYFLAWTTTPWTLPSNLGLAVGPEVTYVKIKDGDDTFILAEALLGSFYKDPSDYTILEKKLGTEYAGIAYEPLFPYFAHLAEEGAFVTRLADFVTTEDGTGIVHIAPGFGEDDYEVFRGSGVTVVCPIDDECQFTAEVPDYQGRFVKDCDKDIITRLKDEGKLVKRVNYLHSYPHCWRCDSPLIYRAVSSWFVDIGKVKDKMLKANDQITWVPDHLKHGRFGKWLENARDWAISRNRYWGNPIPLWRCDSCGEVHCVGSLDELENLSGERVEDLHKHFVDHIEIPCQSTECNGVMQRIPEVLDCWFESGSMPYAQNHYPFENQQEVERHLPADFICEGLDQTRGWFYTLVVLGAALFDKPAFSHVVTNGLVLAEDGKKMSKSLRNYSDPMEVINTFGSDALRFFLMNSAGVRGEEVKYSDDGVKDVLKGVIIPLWNGYSFFVTYANIDNFTPKGLPSNLANSLDKWIVSEAEAMVAEMTKHFDGYDIQRALQPFIRFIDLLNNWYIRRSRRRFWRSENDGDKLEAYETLYYVLMRAIHVIAPVIPFITEEIYQNLKQPGMADSIHLADYPKADVTRQCPELEEEMELAKQTVTMGRALRSQYSLKIRQPLQAIHLVTRDSHKMEVLVRLEQMIKEELNVRSVVYSDNEEKLVTMKAKANFKVLGKQLGPHMKEVNALIMELSMDNILQILRGEEFSLSYSGGTIQLTEESIAIQREEREHISVLNEGDITVALETELTEDLITEGIVRDVIREIQMYRKELDLEITDRIRLTLDISESIREAMKQYEDQISTETLATEIIFASCVDGKTVVCGEDTTCIISVKKQGE